MSPLSFMCLLRHISMILSLFRSLPLVSSVVCSRPRCHLLLLLSSALLSLLHRLTPYPLFLSPLAHSLAPTVILPPHLGSATLLGGRGSRCVFACWVCSQSQLWADGGWSHSHISPCLVLCPPQAERHAKSECFLICPLPCTWAGPDFRQIKQQKGGLRTRNRRVTKKTCSVLEREHPPSSFFFSSFFVCSSCLVCGCHLRGATATRVQVCWSAPHERKPLLLRSPPALSKRIVPHRAHWQETESEQESQTRVPAKSSKREASPLTTTRREKKIENQEKTTLTGAERRGAWRRRDKGRGFTTMSDKYGAMHHAGNMGRNKTLSHETGKILGRFSDGTDVNPLFGSSMKFRTTLELDRSSLTANGQTDLNYFSFLSTYKCCSSVPRFCNVCFSRWCTHMCENVCAGRRRQWWSNGIHLNRMNWTPLWCALEVMIGICEYQRMLFVRESEDVVFFLLWDGGGGYWFLSWCGWKSIFVCHEFLVTKFQLIMMDRAPLEEMNGMCICPVWHQYLVYLWNWAWVFTGIFLVIWLSDAVLINWLSSFKEMQPFFENQCVLMCCHPHVCRLSESSGAHV